MKHRFKAAAATILGVALLLNFTACGIKKASTGSDSKNAASSQPSSSVTNKNVPEGLTLPVTLDKTLNPLITDSMNNLVLWPLMYDCLAEPGQDYKPVLELASSISNSGTTVTVHLKSNVLFSDGTRLTAKDVKYSYDMVKRTPASFFYSNTLNISYVVQQGSATVVFHLSTPDPLFSNLLDIPVIKSGTDTLNNNYNRTGVNIPPVGSGRYVFSSNSVNGQLSYNKSWYNGGQPGFKTIALANMLSGSSTFSSLKIGVINYMLSDYGNGTMPAVGIDATSFCLNRLVFMGVKSGTPGLSDVMIRGAMSLAIDRKSIVTNAFSSRAAGTNMPFNPEWTGYSNPSGVNPPADLTQAESKLSDDGYTVTGSNGALTGSSGGTTVSLKFSLLVDSGDSMLISAAKEIISDLNKAGIVLTLDAEPSDTYNTKLSQGDFDLYLGQINLSDDMDLTPLLNPGGAAAFGTPASGATLAAFNNWRSGKTDIKSVAGVFSSEEPFIPICYKYGSVSYTKGLTGSIAPTYYDIFRNIENWHF